MNFSAQSQYLAGVGGPDRHSWSGLAERLGELGDQALRGEGGGPDLFFGYVADAQGGGCDGVAFGVGEMCGDEVVGVDGFSPDCLGAFEQWLAGDVG